MGAGFGVMLIGSMVVISRWFPPDRFSTMASLVLSIGLVGNLLATTPLAWGTELIGWRGVFGIVVIFTALAAIAVWLIVRVAPPNHPFLQRKVETSGELLRGMVEVLRNPQLPFILVLNFCNYACTFTVQGLWGGPFLREVHGLTIIQSGNVLLAAVLAYQVGMLTFGPLDRMLDTRKWIAIGGTVAIALTLAMLALAGGASLWVAVGGIVAMGFFSASSTMVMTHGRGIFPDRLIGRGMSTMNTCVMLGVACMQTLSGTILGAFAPMADGARSELAYRTLFGFLCAVLLVAVAIQPRARRAAERRAARSLEGHGGSGRPSAALRVASRDRQTLTAILPRLRPSNRPISACGALSRPSTISTMALIFPSSTQRARRASASARWSKKSMTTKPSRRSRLVTTSPGTAIGPGAGFSTSYCETLPQQTMRPRRFISDSAASSTGPPVLSK
jgi:predicted MFS family arabinose efflux permease